MPEPITPEAERLTTSEFHARVHALSPKIAVFDCDGTLWSGDAGTAFMHWSIDTKLISPEQIAWITERYQAYQRGKVSEYDICGQMVQVYRDLPVETLRSAAASFFHDYIEPNIFPELATLIAELQHNGCDIWAVSSTNNWVIEEGARRFHIPSNRVLAARVEVADGVITDRLIHVPTGADKVEALRRVGITAPDVVFGNTMHDAAMLAIALGRHADPNGNQDGSPNGSQAGTLGAFPVNPATALLAHSAARGWPVYYPASATP